MLQTLLVPEADVATLALGRRAIRGRDAAMAPTPVVRWPTSFAGNKLGTGRFRIIARTCVATLTILPLTNTDAPDAALQGAP